MDNNELEHSVEEEEDLDVATVQEVSICTQLFTFVGYWLYICILFFMTNLIDYCKSKGLNA